MAIVSPSVLSVLEQFYSTTYPRHLGLQFPGFGRAQQCGSIKEYLLSPNMFGDASRVLGRLRVYIEHVRPQTQGARVLAAIGDRLATIQSVLDFGCGDGRFLCWIALRSTEIVRVHGVELDTAARDLVRQLPFPERTSVAVVAGLPKHLGFDLIVANYTLHHIAPGEQKGVVQELVELLSDIGVLAILEDSWSDEVAESDSAVRPLDAVFHRLNQEDKRDIFVVNDIQANAWMYERRLACDLMGYRSIDGWRQLLEDVGAEVIWERTVGFDTGRLHGVPSALILARRKPNGMQNNGLCE